MGIVEGCLFGVLLVFLFDVLLAGVTQAALTLCLTAASTLLGVLLTVCKIVISHHSFILIMAFSSQNQHLDNIIIHIISIDLSL